MENTSRDRAAGSGPDRWERLAPGVARRRLPFLDVTVGVVVGADGVLVVDAGSTLREGAALRAEVRELTGRPVGHVALTHAHFDHVFGTAALGDGLTVYGERTLSAQLRAGRERLRADAVRHGVDPVEARRAADALVLPDVDVDGGAVLDLGSREVLLVTAGPGHTGHDLAVVVPGTPDRGLLRRPGGGVRRAAGRAGRGARRLAVGAGPVARPRRRDGRLRPRSRRHGGRPVRPGAARRARRALPRGLTAGAAAGPPARPPGRGPLRGRGGFGRRFQPGGSGPPAPARG